MSKRLFRWIVLLIILLIPFVLAEAYLRYVGLGNPLLYYSNASYRYALQPNQQEVRFRGATVTIDSFGEAHGIGRSRLMPSCCLLATVSLMAAATSTTDKPSHKAFVIGWNSP